MDFNALESSPFIGKLKCSICNNYLSYFPIYLTRNNGNICGRCEIPRDPNNKNEQVLHIRNDVYEILASEITFPCRFSSYGCVRKFLAKEIAKHEDFCDYRLVECPASIANLCSEMMPLPLLVGHCKDKHCELILADTKFKTDLFTSEEHVNIVIIDTGCFIFKRGFDSTTKNFYCSLISSEGDQISDLDSYKLCLKNDNTKVEQSFSKHRRKTFRISLSMSLFDTPGNTNIVQGELINKQIQKAKEEISNEFVDLYCTFCQSVRKYFLFEDEQLSRIASNIFSPCQNREKGCMRGYHPHQLRAHELRCPFRNASCPLNCKWSGLYKEVVPHITTNHVHDFATSNEFSLQICDGFGSLSISKSYLIKYSNYLFRLCFSNLKDCYCWNVQHVGELNGGFYYEIELIDSNSCKKLVAGKACGPLTEDIRWDCCYFMLGQFKDMLTKYILRFKVRIFPNLSQV